MKKVQFKTNINCSGCIASVTPFLNIVDNVISWKVDTDNPDKILEVELEDENVEDVINAVRKAGYSIDQL